MLGGMSKSRESAASARWREIVRDHADSGLSVSAYCRRARVPASSFYHWRRKLREAGTLHETGGSPAPFTEVRLTPASDSNLDSTRNRGALELRLPRGRCVIVRPGFDRQTLLDLVATLECNDANAATLEHGARGPASDVASVVVSSRRTMP